MGLLRVTDALGRSTRFEYDPQHYLAAVIDPQGQRMRYKYDVWGNLLEFTDALGNVTRHEYDSLFRLIRVTDALGQQTRYHYDAVGLLTQVTDAAGNSTSYAYDALNRLTEVTDAHGVKTRYEYDGVGNLLSIVNGRNSRTRFEYDEAGQLIKETDPLGRVTRYEYDAVGNRIRRTDARGQKTDYVYDPVGRLVEVRYHDGTRHRYSFDLAGNLIRMESPASVEEYAYDPLNRLTRLTNVTLNKTVTYTYDAVGNRTSLLDPYGRLLRYEFDELNRVMRFVDPDDRPTSYRYDPLARVTNVTYPNGMQADFTYDRLSRLTDLACRNPAGVLSSFGYSYDQANNVLRRVEEDGATQSYEYDRLCRLTKVTYPEEKIRQLQEVVLTPPNGGPGKPKKSGRALDVLAEQGKGKNQPPGQGKKDDPPGKGPKTQPPGQSLGEPLPAEDIPLVFGSADYAYDETSNRTLLRQDGAATAYHYDAADQLLQAGEETFGYDENGNTVRHQTPTGVVEYRYDGENRLVEARFPDGTWVRYAYDAFGRRVYREEAYWQNKNHLKTEITHYLWDGQQVLMEFDGKDASPLAEYYAVNGQVVAKKMFGYHGRKEPGNDDLIRTRGGLLYYLYDRLGSVVALADRQGQVVTRYYYDVFGEPLAGNLGDVYNAYGFTGKSYDKKLEMYYFGARWLNPTAGRWVTQDPYRGNLVRPMSLTRYLYAENNPVGLIDYWGYQTSPAEYLDVVVMTGLLYAAALVTTNLSIHSPGIEELYGNVPPGAPGSPSYRTGVDAITGQPEAGPPKKGPGRRKDLVGRIIAAVATVLAPHAAEQKKEFEQRKAEYERLVNIELTRGLEMQKYWEKKLGKSCSK